uniref:Uncharacterized protein n=1 Tax=Anguilla anguilla TaxID=7936 RepID=A0A0E9TCD4_ANGAN
MPFLGGHFPRCFSCNQTTITHNLLLHFSNTFV